MLSQMLRKYRWYKTQNAGWNAFAINPKQPPNLALSNSTVLGWSGGAMVLGNLPVCPTKLDKSRARTYFTESRCEWGLFGQFYSPLFFLSSFPLSLGDGPI